MNAFASFGSNGVYELLGVFLGISFAIIIDYQAISLKTIVINIENKEYRKGLDEKPEEISAVKILLYTVV